MKRLSLTVFAAIVIIGCSQSAPSEESIPYLATQDHRFLDTQNPTAGFLGSLADEHPSYPYALGRSYEARGRNEAALKAYEFTVSLGVPPWDAFAAVRGSAISFRRGDLPACLAWAERAVAIDPSNRDGWWYRGTALYRLERYDELLRVIEDFPASPMFTAGFEVGVERFSQEVALWRAVALYESDGEIDRFIRAFLDHPADSIHSRLFLYLYYHDDRFSRFSEEEQLLIEAVYRVAEGQLSEGLRLFLRIDPETMAKWLGTVSEDQSLGLPGVYGTLDDALMAERNGVDRWVSLLREEVDSATEGSAESTQIARRFDLLEARPAVGLGPVEQDASHLRVLDRLPPIDPSEPIAALARSRYIAGHITRGSGLLDVLEAIEGKPFLSDEYELLVDRVMPKLVSDRRWSDLPAILQALPEDARGARGHVQYVMGVLNASGLASFDEASFLEVFGRQEIDFFRVSASALEERSVVSFDPQETEKPLGPVGGRTEPIVIDELDREKPAFRALMYADALVTAGRIQEARRIAMDVAGDNLALDASYSLARRMAVLGYHSSSLDLMRRVYARGERALKAADIPILYPPAYRSEIEAAAVRNGVAIAVLNGLVREESHFRPVAESHVGARGLAQLMPDTADDIARRLNRTINDLDDPEENLLYGAYYLNYLREQIDEPILQIASYNAGLGRGRTWSREFGDLPPRLQIEAIPFIETRWYVRRIAVSASIYQWLRDGTAIETAFDAFVRGDL